jgi:hypothetical protein
LTLLARNSAPVGSVFDTVKPGSAPVSGPAVPGETSKPAAPGRGGILDKLQPQSPQVPQNQ